MLCIKCGVQLTEEDEFCWNCGNPTRYVTTPDTEETIHKLEEGLTDNTEELQALPNINAAIEDAVSSEVDRTYTTESITKIGKGKVIIILVIAFGFLIISCIWFKNYTVAAKVKEQIKLGNKYIQEGKYEEAILAFTKVIEIEPKNIEARVSLSKAYIGLEKYEDAEKVLKEAINIDIKREEPYIEMAKLYIKWNKPYDAIDIQSKGYKNTNSEGIKTMLEETKSKVVVNDLQEVVMVGKGFELPEKVKININNIETESPVTWGIESVDTSKVGIYTFIGTIENIYKKVNLTLNIIGIAIIDDINVTVEQYEKYTLPQKLKAMMTDNNVKEVSVIWNAESVDTSKSGTHNFQGTVENYNKKVALALSVKPKKPNVSTIGNIYTGKTIAEVNKELKVQYTEKKDDYYSDIYGCTINLRNYSNGISIWYTVGEGRIISIATTSPNFPTNLGAKVGDTASSVFEKYRPLYKEVISRHYKNVILEGWFIVEGGMIMLFRFKDSDMVFKNISIRPDSKVESIMLAPWSSFD